MHTVTLSAAGRARLEEIREAAVSAAGRPARLGPDIDVTSFHEPSEHQRVGQAASIERQIREAALMSGFTTDEQQRSASYFQLDRTPIYERVTEAFDGLVEVMSTEDALRAFPDELIERWWWRAVDPGTDKYTALVALHQTEGYFIRVRAGATIEKPIQACLFVSESSVSQNVHNIIVVERGASATVLTGCTISTGVTSGLHAAVSEFYVEPGGHLTFTMVHNWGEGFDVRPRTGIVLEDDATYVNNYVLLKPVRSLQAFPVAHCRGARSRAVFNSIVYGIGSSEIDLGSEIRLIGEGSSGEAVARTLSFDESVVYSRGRLVGRTDACRAHLDCRGIVLSPRSVQWAVPDLVSEGAPGAELSHEAAISPIAEEEVRYLMSRGIPESEAVSLITRGFVNIEIPGLPAVLRRQIDEALMRTEAHAM